MLDVLSLCVCLALLETPVRQLCAQADCVSLAGSEQAQACSTPVANKMRKSTTVPPSTGQPDKYTCLCVNVSAWLCRSKDFIQLNCSKNDTRNHLRDSSSKNLNSVIIYSCLSPFHSSCIFPCNKKLMVDFFSGQENKRTTHDFRRL